MQHQTNHDKNKREKLFGEKIKFPSADERKEKPGGWMKDKQVSREGRNLKGQSRGDRESGHKTSMARRRSHCTDGKKPP